MSELEALEYQSSHLHVVLVEFSENFDVRVQLMLVLMSVYR